MSAQGLRDKVAQVQARRPNVNFQVFSKSSKRLVSRTKRVEPTSLGLGLATVNNGMGAKG